MKLAPSSTLFSTLGILAVLFANLIPFASGADDAKKAEDKKKEASNVYQLKSKSLAGKDVDMAKYRGHVLLIVNVASECGYTPQYRDLQALQEKYAEKGLRVLGFPCNQFGKQEPGSPEEIAAFCSKNYGVTFDMFEKADVNGSDQCDVYKYLTAKDTTAGKFAGPIKWNFEKFLVARDGTVVGRYTSDVEPQSPAMIKAIEAELAKK